MSWILTKCWLKLPYVNSIHHKCPLPCHFAFHFTEFELIWRDLDFLQNNHFLLINQYFPQNWLFWENMSYVAEWWSETWIWLIMNDFWLNFRAFNHWIRVLDDWIITNWIFSFKLWKNLIKNLGKKKFDAFGKIFLEFFFWGS